MRLRMFYSAIVSIIALAIGSVLPFIFSKVEAQSGGWVVNGSQIYTSVGIDRIGFGTNNPTFPLTIQAFAGPDPSFSRLFAFYDQGGSQKRHLNFNNGGFTFVE